MKKPPEKLFISLQDTLFSWYLFKRVWIKYQNFYQIFDISYLKTELDEETTGKAFH